MDVRQLGSAARGGRGGQLHDRRREPSHGAVQRLRARPPARSRARCAAAGAGRRGTVPTEFGVRVIERARAIRSEIEALHKDLSMLQGLETGHATLGVVGTVSRLLVPMVVAEMRRSAPGVSLRLTEGASGTTRGRSRRTRARERGRDRTGERFRGSTWSTCATKTSSRSCHGTAPAGPGTDRGCRKLARETLILPACRKPVARRGRDRGAR